MTDAALAVALREAALLEGEFTLRSGRKSRYYFDKYLFETEPELLREVALRLARFVDDSITRIAGAELGGVALAAAVSLVTGKPFVIVRNARKADYGTGRLIEGRLEPGDRVLLVEDVATTGGQAVEAVRALRRQGAEVSAVVVVIDRQEGGRQAVEAAGVRFHCLFTAGDLGISL
jgi:orotate phosphoribosyltransferase